MFLVFYACVMVQWYVMYLSISRLYHKIGNTRVMYKTISKSKKSIKKYAGKPERWWRKVPFPVETIIAQDRVLSWTLFHSPLLRASREKCCDNYGAVIVGATEVAVDESSSTERVNLLFQTLTVSAAKVLETMARHLLRQFARVCPSAGMSPVKLV